MRSWRRKRPMVAEVGSGVGAAGVVVTARAKINLCLHVVGRRADGYHLLDSLVAFVGAADIVRGERAEALSLDLSGPMAKGLGAGPDNLVLRAAALYGRGARLGLEKHLPVASGIGGGSADAAASLRVMAKLYDLPLPGPEAVLALGADVPVCLAGQSCRMEGIGERLTPVALPQAWVVLVNPGVAVSTPQVFRALASRENPGLGEIPPLPDVGALAGWLAGTRNDLQAAAEALCPQVTEVLAALARQEGCLLARMSGSGATCFGLFSSRATANAAFEALRGSWSWVAATRLRGGPAD